MLGGGVRSCPAATIHGGFRHIGRHCQRPGHHCAACLRTALIAGRGTLPASRSSVMQRPPWTHQGMNRVRWAVRVTATRKGGWPTGSKGGAQGANCGCTGWSSPRGVSSGMPRVLPGIEVNGGRLAADECRAIIVGICAFAGLGPPRSVLICDDRPAARQGLLELLRPLSSVSEIRCVSDGFSLVDAAAGEPVDLVLGIHPSTVIIVVGSAGDIDVLARAYLRGPRGMLLWEPPAAPWN